MRVLFIGGTGEISLSCVRQAVAAGHAVTVFNRGSGNGVLPAGVEVVTGDATDSAALRGLADRRFDAVCQFLAYTADDVRRDVAAFGGKTGQYLFIGSASSYRKPPTTYRITEDIPLANPFSAYSRNKTAAEAALLAQRDLPVTIVRPSHTIRTRFPTALGEQHLLAWRVLQGKPVVVHGDGSSLWTVTRSEDFAVPFIRLFGHPAALGEAMHITADRAFTWDQLYGGIGQVLGAEVEIVHIPSDTIVRFLPDLAAALHGDKAASVIFDTAKIKRLVGDFACVTDLPELLAGPAEAYRAGGYRPGPADLALDATLDRMIAAQRSVAPD